MYRLAVHVYMYLSLSPQITFLQLFPILRQTQSNRRKLTLTVIAQITSDCISIVSLLPIGLYIWGGHRMHYTWKCMCCSCGGHLGRYRNSVTGGLCVLVVYISDYLEPRTSHTSFPCFCTAILSFSYSHTFILICPYFHSIEIEHGHCSIHCHIRGP